MFFLVLMVLEGFQQVHFILISQTKTLIKKAKFPKKCHWLSHKLTTLYIEFEFV